MTLKFPAAVLAASLLAGGAFAQDMPAPGLKVEGGTTKGDMLIVPEVMMDKPGFVVIHEMIDGKPVVPQSIGHVAVAAGTTPFVEVPVQGGLKKGTEYMVMLHYDTNDNGEYEFGPGSTDVDTPVTDAAGVVMKPLMTAM
jgi:hypothetical protein